LPYSHSFGPDFYWGDYSLENVVPKSHRPTSVVQALASMSNATWARLARQVFGCSPDHLDLDAVMARVVATDTCGNLNAPVEVWIDPEGDFTIRVFN
jgi:hypothetical protein